MKINSPIVLICFNRPNETKKVLNKIKSIRPQKLFIIMDGPRKNNVKDKINCKKVEKIVSNLQLSCKILKNFSNKNLGLKKRIKTGLNWVFTKTDKAIILEDDCLPRKDFFYFCDNLLEYYKYSKKVRFITGNNFQNKNYKFVNSYYFSKYSHIWGWATWRDSWKLYKDNDLTWEKYLNSKKFEEICPKIIERRYWRSMFQKVRKGKLKSWSLYFLFSLWKAKGLTATPKFNLVRNLGFNKKGTNTKNMDIFLNNKYLKLGKDLNHPNEILQNISADNYVFNNVYNTSLSKKISNLIFKFFND